MKQWSGTHYQMIGDMVPFTISDVDVNFYACRYVGDKMGFVIDKDAFYRQLEKGKIQVARQSIAV